MQEDYWHDGNLCGGEPYCTKCGVRVPRYWPMREDDAVTTWSTRPVDDTPPASGLVVAATKAIQAVWQDYALPVGPHLFEQMALAALSAAPNAAVVPDRERLRTAINRGYVAWLGNAKISLADHIADALIAGPGDSTTGEKA
jgi:hypothetical protein